MAENPLFVPSTLPFQVPPFAEIADDHYLPAFERGMADHLAEIDTIVADADPPSFDNTIGALERAGQLLKRASAAFFAVASSHATDAVRALEVEISPRLAAHWDAVHMHRGLYGRMRQVEGADAEEAWVLERYRLDFTRAGAELSDADQDRLRELNQELSPAVDHVQAGAARRVDRRGARRRGPGAARRSLGQRACRRRPEGSRTGQQLHAPTAELHEPARPQRAHEPRHPAAAVRAVAQPGTGEPGAGHPHGDLAGRARPAPRLPESRRVRRRRSDRQDRRCRRGDAGAVERPGGGECPARGRGAVRAGGVPDRAVDWSFYAEKVRKARYDFDQADMRPYFELDRVITDGVFQTATDLYGITFNERRDLPAYHPDVRTFDVFDADGSPLGLFLLDPYARPTKQGGAWMSRLVGQSHLLDEQPVVMNNLNITRPQAGPTLMTFDEVTTAFHEFGHALHGLLSDVRFPRVSGTSVPRDFVEFPSQVNEMWVTWPEVLGRYARHHETGEPMPQALVDRMKAAEKFNQGFLTLEYLKASLLDWAWHTIAPGTAIDDAEAFEAAALEAAGVDFPLVNSRYRTSYFAHIFGGGYSAGYYSYIWSEVLDADTVEWFEENGGLTRANGDHFRQTLLSRGGSGDPMDAFRAFRGRDPRIEPLLERRGLA